MFITREPRDRLSRPVWVLFARSAIDIRLCFARGAIFVHRNSNVQAIFIRWVYRHRQGHSGLRGIAMSEPIKSQSISRRRLFWLAVTAAALAAPATILSTSDVRAQQSDQAPPPNQLLRRLERRRKRKRRRRQRQELRPLLSKRAVRHHHQNSSRTGAAVMKSPSQSERQG